MSSLELTHTSSSYSVMRTSLSDQLTFPPADTTTSEPSAPGLRLASHLQNMISHCYCSVDAFLNSHAFETFPHSGVERHKIVASKVSAGFLNPWHEINNLYEAFGMRAV